MITSISPAVGHPGGGFLLVISGSAFSVPVVTAPTTLPDAGPAATMAVTVGGRTATQIEVWDSGLLTCLCPSYRGDPATLSADPGVDVDVVVTNLGPPAEATTVNDGFTYRRTDLTRDESELKHVLRWLVLELRRQVIENVVITTHPDYDGTTADGLDIVEMAKIPGIALFGPRLLSDTARQMRGNQAVQDLTSLEFIESKPHRARKLGFTATLVGETAIELLQLEQEFEAFFQRNGALAIPRDTGDDTSEAVDFPIFLTSPPDRTGAAGSSGTVSASAQFELHGVELDADGGIRVRWGEILGDPADLVARGVAIP